MGEKEIRLGSKSGSRESECGCLLAALALWCQKSSSRDRWLRNLTKVSWKFSTTESNESLVYFRLKTLLGLFFKLGLVKLALNELPQLFRLSLGMVFALAGMLRKAWLHLVELSSLKAQKLQEEENTWVPSDCDWFLINQSDGSMVERLQAASCKC